MALLPQLLLVEINPGLFRRLFACCLVSARRSLGDSEGQSAPTGHIHHRQGRNLQPPFGPTATTVEKVPQPERLFAALRNKRGILRRDQLRARIQRCSHDTLVKVRPVKGCPELTRNRALGVLAVTTQITTSDAPTEGQNSGKQHSKELPLWLTNRRHLLQNVTDNCHRP